MRDPGLRITASEDRKAVSVELSTELDARRITMSAEHLDKTIQGLATARASMLPAVPASPDGAQMPMLARAQAVIPADRIDGKRVIKFRHPGFGWLSFELKDTDAADLAMALIATMRTDQASKKA
ncbi:hypothetical protein GCM10007887_42580 [Methylobacterium haplocladii]|uniref:Uncharacterized protein n=2 Tax=Methylobacterium haplocladii TaxID=1176176 RepID=A0A512IW47_9HYPH|nr:hypothetical protein MHA02_42930 [Methylobacterium haplocladii]GLS61537.1 hypothetical protein GCM10007887_42580 [Methylobacterium haplocladii]